MSSPERVRRFSLSSRGLRLWGIVFAAMGMIGYGIVQNVLLGIGSVNDVQELVSAMETDPKMIQYASGAILLQAIETCAVPVFAFLLVEGFIHTSDIKAYLIRVLGVAVLSELPYNLVTSGVIWDTSYRNPVFALVFGLVMMLFYDQFAESSAKNNLAKLMITLGGLAWAIFLKIQNGLPILLMVAVLWAFRESRKKQVLFGVLAAVACCAYSPFFAASVLGVLGLLLYTGERGRAENKWANYLAYPVLLLAIGVAAKFM